VAGPFLGRLSDRYGRRPVLILSQAGTALSFLILGLAHDFPTMLMARALDGASGGNILVAQAYVADVTTPENRSRGLGLIGMAFGLGFVLGPLMGGLLLRLPIDPYWRLRVPFLVGAGFSTLAWVLVLVRLPESLPADVAARRATRVLSWHGLIETATHPAIGLLVLVGALVTLTFAALEATYSLFLRERMGWGTDQAGGADKAAFAFAFLGLVSAVVQGGFIRRLVPRFGEPRLILAGIATLAAGLTLMAGVSGAVALGVATLVVAVGQGLVSPTLSGLLSKVTPSGEQGAVFGTLTSAQTLARMISYMTANVLFARIGPPAPYWIGGAIAAATLAPAWAACRRATRSGETLAEAAAGVAPVRPSSR
jgi:DHA1 family tetracycline resistance protein-like MFS transporter